MKTILGTMLGVAITVSPLLAGQEPAPAKEKQKQDAPKKQPPANQQQEPQTPEKPKPRWDDGGLELLFSPPSEYALISRKA
jgi:hypothetical protein